MFSFIFFLSCFSIPFYLRRLSVAFRCFSFWPWKKRKTTTSVRRGLSVSGRDQFRLQSDSFLDCINVWKLPALGLFFLLLSFSSSRSSTNLHRKWSRCHSTVIGCRYPSIQSRLEIDWRLVISQPDWHFEWPTTFFFLSRAFSFLLLFSSCCGCCVKLLRLNDSLIWDSNFRAIGEDSLRVKKKKKKKKKKI